jgi:hypothetical protein
MPKLVLTEKLLRSLLTKHPAKRITYTEPGRTGWQVRLATAQASITSGAGPLSWSGSVTDSLNALQLNPSCHNTRGRGLRTPM